MKDKLLQQTYSSQLIILLGFSEKHMDLKVLIRYLFILCSQSDSSVENIEDFEFLIWLTDDGQCFS